MQKEKPKTKSQIGFSLSPLFSLIPIHAENIDLTTIPQYLGDNLGIGTFAGGILCFILLMMMTVLPMAIITRGKKSGFIPELALTIGVMGFCIAIEWLPYWFLLILSMLIALMFSGKMRDLITGGK